MVVRGAFRAGALALAAACAAGLFILGAVGAVVGLGRRKDPNVLLTQFEL